MSVTVEWYDESQRVMVTRFKGSWTIREATDAHRQANANLKSVAHPVAVIFDFSTSSMLPSDLLSGIRNSKYERSPDNIADDMAIVGTSFFLKSLVDIARRIYAKFVPSNIHFVDSVDEAANLLHRKL